MTLTQDAGRSVAPGLIVRAATPADYAEITRVTVETYRATGYFEPDSPYLDSIAQTEDRAEHAELLLAENPEGRIIGAVTLTPYGTKYADICREGELEFRMLAVDPAAQRSGAGRALVRAVVERARELGVSRVALSTGREWHAARRLYESLGFTRVPERDWAVPRNGAPLVVYTFDLILHDQAD